MRAVRYLVDEIEAAVGASDTDTARDKLQELRRQSTRLSSMLSALLHYSSAGLSQAGDREGRYPRAGDGSRALAAARGNQGRRSAAPGRRWTRSSRHWTSRCATSIDNTFKHHDRGSGNLRISLRRCGQRHRDHARGRRSGHRARASRQRLSAVPDARQRRRRHGARDRPEDGRRGRRHDHAVLEPGRAPGNDIQNSLAKANCPLSANGAQWCGRRLRRKSCSPASLRNNKPVFWAQGRTNEDGVWIHLVRRRPSRQEERARARARRSSASSATFSSSRTRPSTRSGSPRRCACCSDTRRKSAGPPRSATPSTASSSRSPACSFSTTS